MPESLTELPVTLCSPRPTVARTDDGEEFHDPRRVYALAEDAECLTMCLDATGVPKEEEGNVLSLWGRVQRYAQIVANVEVRYQHERH